MLRNLLSGHPDLFVIPFESHFFEHIDRTVEYEYRKQRSKGLALNQTRKNFVDWIRTENEAVDPMGDTFVTGRLNVKSFEHSFEINENDTSRSVFEKYVLSIHESLGLGKLSNDRRVVEKSVENAEFAQELAEMYPEARFIHIVRNPYANFVSLRKYKSIGVGYPLLHRMVRTFRNSYHYLFENQKRIKHYKVVRYEDILTDTEKVMRDLADFLQLAFVESMLVPSHLGETWSGNSTTGKSFKGLSGVDLNVWQQEIYPDEVRCVNKVADRVISLFDYEKWHASVRRRKTSDESFLRNIFNRVFVLLFC
jgi:hypothetical protein